MNRTEVNEYIEKSKNETMLFLKERFPSIETNISSATIGYTEQENVICEMLVEFSTNEGTDKLFVESHFENEEFKIDCYSDTTTFLALRGTPRKFWKDGNMKEDELLAYLYSVFKKRKEEDERIKRNALLWKISNTRTEIENALKEKGYNEKQTNEIIQIFRDFA